MTQQQPDAAPPPTPTVYSRPLRVLIVGFLVIMAFGLGNIIYSADTRRSGVQPWSFSSTVLR